MRVSPEETTEHDGASLEQILTRELCVLLGTNPSEPLSTRALPPSP